MFCSFPRLLTYSYSQTITPLNWWRRGSALPLHLSTIDRAVFQVCGHKNTQLDEEFLSNFAILQKDAPCALRLIPGLALVSLQPIRAEWRWCCSCWRWSGFWAPARTRGSPGTARKAASSWGRTTPPPGSQGCSILYRLHAQESPALLLSRKQSKYVSVAARREAELALPSGYGRSGARQSARRVIPALKQITTHFCSCNYPPQDLITVLSCVYAQSDGRGIVSKTTVGVN